MISKAVAARVRRGAMPEITSQEAVVSYHSEATEAGLAMLSAGGNAFDAFIAATMAEYVVAEGGTSLAGPLGVLLYDAKRREVRYLDAEFNDVVHKMGRWRPGDPVGKAILVPGAPAGLKALSAQYGRLSFSQCLAPAIRLARNGFTLNELYGRNIELCAGSLRSTPYGRKTFFRRGISLGQGDTLRQPELAALLERLASSGVSYMYRGRWASRFVDAARAHGGRISKNDLARYGAEWRQPWQTSYRGYTLYSCSGRTFGGLWTMLCLKALEQTKPRSLVHFSRSARALETLVRTIRQVWEEFWLLDYRLLDDAELVNARLSTEYGARIWKRVREGTPSTVKAHAGSHSYHIIVRDQKGNVASGTNTHESLAWGAGIFIEGVPVPASGYLPWSTRPGQRRISPLSMLFAFQDRTLRFSTGSFSSSILEASLQFMVNLIDYQLTAQDAATLPRVGTYPHNPVDFLSEAAGRATGDRVDGASNWLDPRINAKLVSILERRGLAFVPNSAHRRRQERHHRKAREQDTVGDRFTVDTGLGALLAVRPDGRVEGAVAPSLG